MGPLQPRRRADSEVDDILWPLAHAINVRQRERRCPRPLIDGLERCRLDADAPRAVRWRASGSAPSSAAPRSTHTSLSAEDVETVWRNLLQATSGFGAVCKLEMGSWEWRNGSRRMEGIGLNSKVMSMYNIIHFFYER